MRNIRESNGITLIALVITIIVMLILVGVTITMAVNGGLFKYSGDAARGTEEAKETEKNWVTLDENMSTDDLIAKYTGENTDLIKLKKYFVGKSIDEIKSDNKYVNNEIISDAQTSIQDIENEYYNNIIKYNKRYYKTELPRMTVGVFPGTISPGTPIHPISNIDDNDGRKYKDVIELNEKEKLILVVTNNGILLGKDTDNEINYYQYNNKRYKIYYDETNEQFEIEEYNSSTLKDVTQFQNKITIQGKYTISNAYEYENMTITTNDTSGRITINGMTIYATNDMENDYTTSIILTGLETGKTKTVIVEIPKYIESEN